ncbi:class I SAM-dependent methyltransferase [Candidatus Saganbacteria bacterium]|nr:class I SAM-dependent methyltransferase [Candidatus Saganbacteria bacterium]
MNIALAPLTMAKEEFGGKICGYPISYVKGDARELPFANSSFDLVATHLFLGHFPNNEKKCVLEEAYRVLQKGRDFVDAEIVVEQWFDKAEYIKTFAELGKKFKGTSNERKRAGDYLKKFASFFPFYPYTLSPYFNPGYPYERLFDVSWFIRIKVDLDKQGFVADLHGSNPQALYPGCEARICQIRARKE